MLGELYVSLIVLEIHTHTVLSPHRLDVSSCDIPFPVPIFTQHATIIQIGYT